MTTTTLSYRAIHNNMTSVSMPRIPWKLVYFFSAVSFLLLLVFYVYSVNELTRGVYVIKDYNKNIAVLSAENRVLETNFANSGFLEGVQEKVKKLNFEKTTNVTYVQILDSPLAQVPKNY